MKKILLGIHNQGLGKALERYFEYDYQVTCVETLDQMFEKMGLKSTDPGNIYPLNHFDTYIMDVNLGSPGDRILEPALKIYSHIKEGVKSKKIKFMTITGNPQAEEDAHKVGIPCMDKDARKLFAFIEGK